jgi:hypothetical protein
METFSSTTLLRPKTGFVFVKRNSSLHRSEGGNIVGKNKRHYLDPEEGGSMFL